MIIKNINFDLNDNKLNNENNINGENLSKRQWPPAPPNWLPPPPNWSPPPPPPGWLPPSPPNWPPAPPDSTINNGAYIPDNNEAQYINVKENPLNNNDTSNGNNLSNNSKNKSPNYAIDKNPSDNNSLGSNIATFIVQDEPDHGIINAFHDLIMNDDKRDSSVTLTMDDIERLLRSSK
ncbi:hypothetical protein U3516DRAFT_825532 [Neocallimastix sp. 'constans']